MVMRTKSNKNKKLLVTSISQKSPVHPSSQAHSVNVLFSGKSSSQKSTHIPCSLQLYWNKKYYLSQNYAIYLYDILKCFLENFILLML